VIHYADPIAFSQIIIFVLKMFGLLKKISHLNNKLLLLRDQLQHEVAEAQRQQEQENLRNCAT